MDSAIDAAYNRSMNDLKLWEILLTFSQQKTLTQTARALYMSQPGVSQALQRLEKELGVSLFERSGHNQIRLNATGRFAAQKAQELLNQELEAEKSIQAYDRSVTQISVGSCAPLPLWTLNPLLSALTERTASFVMEPSAEALHRGLEQGTFELAVLPEPASLPGLRSAFFLRETLELAVPRSHPLASRTEITYQDLQGQNLLLFENIGIWKELVRKNLPDTHFLRIDDYSVFADAARTGAFPFFTTDQLDDSVPSGFLVLPVHEPDAAHDFYLTVRTESESLLESLIREARTERDEIQSAASLQKPL